MKGTIDGKEDIPLKVRIGKNRKPASGKKELRHAKSFLRQFDKIARTGSSSRSSKKVGRNTFVKTPLKSAQRVIVKAHFVKQNNSVKSKAALKAHVSYLTRDGVCNVEGQTPDIYSNGQSLTADEVQIITDKIAEDKHHFRFIISPENAHKLDLNEYTEELIKQIENDLGTQLNYVAVNHYNTDNPHTHLLISGRDKYGQTLIINRDYIANGIRGRACELATKKLGYRSELEIRDGITKEVNKERYTQIDGDLIKLAKHDGLVDMRNKQAQDSSFSTFKRNIQTQRLKYLESLNLAQEVSPAVWKLDDSLQQTLRDLGTRGDIIKTMHKELKESGQEHVIFDVKSANKSITGVVVSKGLVNELNDQKYMIISATDNRAYYVPLSKYAEEPGLEAVPGSIVTVSPQTSSIELKKSDKNIMAVAVANDGVYSPDKHMQQINSFRLPEGVTKESFIANHLKRLEVLESRGIVERGPDNSWKVPNDLENKIIEVSEKTASQAKHIKVILESRQGLTQQIEVAAPTWIDRQLAGGVRPDPEGGRHSTFKDNYDNATRQRLEKLCEMQLAEKSNEGIKIKKEFLLDLYKRQIETANKELSRYYGTPIDLQSGSKFKGEITKVIHLPSGAHVVVKDGNQFACIPYKRGMEQGKHITFEVPKQGGQGQVLYKIVGNEKDRGR